MKRIFLAMCLWCASNVPGSAQIPFVTVRTPRSPGPPGMMLVQTNTPPTQAAQPGVAPRVLQPLPPVRPSMDKPELDRRVVAFQKKRALEGSPSAQYELGMRYLKGDGVVKDMVTARKWLGDAVRGGSTEARKKLMELDADAKQ